MKKIIFALTFSCLIWTSKANTTRLVDSKKEEIEVTINLTDVKNDQVLVTVNVPKITTDEITSVSYTHLTLPTILLV